MSSKRISANQGSFMVLLSVFTLLVSTLAAVPPSNAQDSKDGASSIVLNSSAGSGCFIKSGLVSCWGNNEYGQLTVPKNLTDVASLALGNRHACALRSSGSVSCWGDNNAGQTDVPTNLGTTVQISSEDRTTCSLSSVGKVSCWGANEYGQINVPENLGAVALIAVAGGTVCAALVNNGSVTCWGANNWNQLNVPSGLNNVVQFAVMGASVCALKSSGDVVCWGANDTGQMNIPDSVHNVVQITKNAWQVCALISSGSIICWGNNNGNPTAFSNVMDAKSITMSNTNTGKSFYCWTNQSDMVKCGGDNSFGETSVPYPSTPVIVSLDQLRGRTYKATWLPAESNSRDASLEYKVKLVSADKTNINVCETAQVTCTFKATNLDDAQLVVTAISFIGESMEQIQSESKVLVGAGHYSYPMDGAMDSNGNIYVPVSDNGGRDSHFDKISPDGVITRLFDVGFHWWPDNVSVAITPDDKYLFFTDQDSDPFGCGFRLVKVTLATLQQTTVQTGLCAPSNVAIDRDGSVVLKSGGRVQAITWWKFSSEMVLLGQTTESEYNRIVLLNHQDSMGHYFTSECVGYCSADTTIYVLHYNKWVVPGGPAIPTPIQVLLSGKPNSLVVTWTAVESPDSDSTVTYTATASSSGMSCTTTSTSCEIAGLTDGQTYSVTVIADDGTNRSNPSSAVAGMPGVAPGPPTNVSALAGSELAQISWRAPSVGSPMTNLQYKVTSNPGGLTCSTSSTSCMVSGLTNGRSYTFSVVATTVVGSSTPAVSDSVIPGTSPDQVAELTTLARSSSSVTVGWSAPNSNGASISNYLIRISSDNGLTWSDPTDTASTSTSYVISGLPSATARLVEVAAKNSKGQGPWSDSFLTKSKGAKLVRVTVQDLQGEPVSGGAITWRMSDGSAYSAKTYGLTADGIIDFPYAPAGAVNVSLTNGQMTDGSIVSGSWSSVLGFDTAVLVVPSNASYSARTVHVQLPNGYPVANVKVAVSGNGLTSTREVEGFNFRQQKTSASGYTDTSGNFTVFGYWDGIPSAHTEYNDGIIVQLQDNPLVSATTNVELDYMPWVSFDSSQVTGDAGAPQVVQVSAVDSESSNLRGRHYLTNVAPVKAGVAVTLVPPKGVKASKCANGKPQKLTGTTGANGKAKLTICAFKSGIYTLKTAGAASVGSIRVLVKGAAPLSPTSVNVTSPVVGQLRASWNKPIYDGGSAVTQYTITAQAAGKPTVKKVIKATVNKKGIVIKAPSTLQVLTGLSNATIYTVTITSTTKNGTSDAYTAKVPVA